MTRLRISAEGVAALGDRLAELADHLEDAAARSRGTGSHGFVDASAEGAVDALLGDYELERVRLCEHLRSLAGLARSAGACYVDTEAMIARRVTPEIVAGRNAGLR